MISPPSISAIFGDDAVHELAVVRGHQQRAGQRLEEALEPDDRLDVEVVGRLVHQQDVGPAEQHARHRDAHLPAARERADVAVDPLVVEAEAVQHFARLRSRARSRRGARIPPAPRRSARGSGPCRRPASGSRHRVLQRFELVVQIAERGRCRRSPRRAPSGPTSPRRPGGSSRSSASSGPRRRPRRALPRRRSSGTASSCRSRSGRRGRPSRRD